MDETSFTPRLRAGDQSVIGDVLLAYGGRLKGWLRAVWGGLLDEHGVLEVIEDALLFLWENRSRLDPSVPPLGILFWKVKMLAIDAHRKRVRRPREQCLGAADVALPDQAQPAAEADDARPVEAVSVLTQVRTGQAAEGDDHHRPALPPGAVGDQERKSPRTGDDAQRLWGEFGHRAVV